MSLLTYLKSSVSSWFVHQNKPLRDLYFGVLRPAYVKRAAKLEKRQWSQMGLAMVPEEEICRQIKQALSEKRPYSAAKMGATEYFALRWWLGEKVIASRIDDLYTLSGIFPCNQEFFRKYCEVYAQSLQSLDVLGLWTGKDEPSVYKKLGLKSAITHFNYFSGNFPRIGLGGDPGWFPAMKGYRVMIVSSFAELIQQRANEEDWNRYWAGRIPWIAPEKLVAVPFPYGFEKSTQERYTDSIDLLDKFKQEHQALMEDSDIVIFGCGAYAVPLLDWTRQAGKVAIHMGGDIQLLFGIKGARWDELPALYNEHWVRPSAHLIPQTANKVENSCYW